MSADSITLEKLNIVQDKAVHLIGTPSTILNIYSLHHQSTVAAVFPTSRMHSSYYNSSQTCDIYRQVEQAHGNTVLCRLPSRSHSILTWKCIISYCRPKSWTFLLYGWECVHQNYWLVKENESSHTKTLKCLFNNACKTLWTGFFPLEFPLEQTFQLNWSGRSWGWGRE